MKIALITGAAVLCFAASVAAQPPANVSRADLDVAHARADHVAALKSGDKARIASTEATLKHAYLVDADYHQQDARYAKLPPSGEPREAALALLRAQDAAQDAQLSGNPHYIAETKAELRLAYQRNYAATHPHAAHH